MYIINTYTNHLLPFQIVAGEKRVMWLKHVKTKNKPSPKSPQMGGSLLPHPIYPLTHLIRILGLSGSRPALAAMPAASAPVSLLPSCAFTDIAQVNGRTMTRRRRHAATSKNQGADSKSNHKNRRPLLMKWTWRNHSRSWNMQELAFSRRVYFMSC